MTKHVKAFDPNPEPTVEPPEPEVVARCCECGGDIYSGETCACAVRCDGFICQYCIDDMWRDQTLDEKIELLGLEKTIIERIKRK